MALNGIDISKWDEGLAVRGVPADFVICKATEGVGYTDRTFQGFARQVTDSGRLLGAYHFARSTSSPEAQAEWFSSVVAPHLGHCLLALDWENAETYDMQVLAQGPSWARRWLDRVRELTGVSPVIYTSKSVCNEYDWRGVAADYRLWGAEYATNDPVYGYQAKPWQSRGHWGAWGARPTIHQYTGQLRLAGLGDKGLDGNIAYLTREEWGAMAGGGKAPEPTPPEPLEVDGRAGTLTVSAWQRAMGTMVDGVITGQPDSVMRWQPNLLAVRYSPGAIRGSELVRAVQRKLGVDVDGIMGPGTIGGLQMYLRGLGHYDEGIDGVFGPATARGLQESLNAGEW